MRRKTQTSAVARICIYIIIFDLAHMANTQTRVLAGAGEGSPSDGESPSLDSAASCSPEIRNCCWGLVHGLLRRGHCSLTKTTSPLYIYHYVTRNENSYEGVGAVFKLL